MEIRTHRAEMNMDNGYDLPAIHENATTSRVARVTCPEGLTSPSVKKASDGRKLENRYQYPVSARIKIHVMCLNIVLLRWIFIERALRK